VRITNISVSSSLSFSLFLEKRITLSSTGERKQDKVAAQVLRKTEVEDEEEE
jgi:hypothetical protein